MLVTLIILLNVIVHPLSEKVIISKWKADHMKSVVEISLVSENEWQGIIIESEKPEWIGKIVVKLEEKKQDKAEWQGLFIVPSIGMEIPSSFEVKDNKLQLVGKKLFITKTYEWNQME